jgi:hypothetical protein
MSRASSQRANQKPSEGNHYACDRVMAGVGDIADSLLGKVDKVCVQRTNNGAGAKKTGGRAGGKAAWACNGREPEPPCGLVINPAWIGYVRSVRSSAAKFQGRLESSCGASTTIL